MQQLKENTLFANRYKLIRMLGQGGFSEVWLATDSITNLDIAVKIYAPGRGMDSDGMKEFSAELAKVYYLNHQNLLKPQHVDAWEGMPYLIMAYCSQGSLTKKVGKMSEDEIWQMISDVAAGLDYLHRNDIIHQDIKPDNILIDDNGTYVITDFGISMRARSTLQKSMSKVSQSFSSGTMSYMGPERFSKQPAPIKASDIWSFGSMVFELLMGNVPFGTIGGGLQKGGAEIPEITADVSQELKDLIDQMLAVETWDRPTAEQLHHIAQQHCNPSALGHQTAPITPTPNIGQTVNENKKKKTGKQQPQKADNTPNKEQTKEVKSGIGRKILIIVAVIVVLAGIGGFIGYKSYQTKQQAAQDYWIEQISNFDAKLNSANQDDLQTIEETIVLLQKIQEAEESKFIAEDEKLYPTKRQNLINKCNNIERILQSDYNFLLQEGWGEEEELVQKTKNKLNTIKKLKNKI